MGKIGDAVNTVLNDPSTRQQTLEAKVERLTKLVHILWKEAERLESMVHATSDGLQIKTGMSELSVTKYGGIIINAQRLLLKSATRNELWL